MERSFLKKSIDYLQKVGRQLLASDTNTEGVESQPTNDNQKDKRPLSLSLQSEIRNLDNEIK